MKDRYWRVQGLQGQIQGWLPAAPRRGQQGMDYGQGLYGITEGVGLLGQISRLDIDRISSPELWGAQGLVSFPIQGWLSMWEGSSGLLSSFSPPFPCIRLVVRVGSLSRLQLTFARPHP